MTIASPFNVAVNSQRTSSEDKIFRPETFEITTQESTRNLDLPVRLLLSSRGSFGDSVRNS